MAGPRTRCNTAFIDKDEFAERASTENSGTPTLIPAISYTPTSAPTQALVPAFTPTPAPGLPDLYIDVDL